MEKGFHHFFAIICVRLLMIAENALVNKAKIMSIIYLHQNGLFRSIESQQGKSAQ